MAAQTQSSSSGAPYEIVVTELQAAEISQFIIMGCATDYCVDATIRSALARGYRTIIPANGHTTAERPHLGAEQIIAHHNAIWSDYIAAPGPAIITSCEALIGAAELPTA